MLLNFLHCVGPPSSNGLIWPQMRILPRLRNCSRPPRSHAPIWSRQHHLTASQAQGSGPALLLWFVSSRSPTSLQTEAEYKGDLLALFSLTGNQGLLLAILSVLCFSLAFSELILHVPSVHSKGNTDRKSLHPACLGVLSKSDFTFS